jgi:lactoylglutathione lyase
VIGGVSKVALEVEDQARAFWTETLGFELVQGTPYGQERWPEVRKGARPTPRDPSLPTSNVMFYAEDLQQADERLSARGVQVPQAPVRQSFGWWSLFQDPDGNRFALTPRDR